MKTLKLTIFTIIFMCFISVQSISAKEIISEKSKMLNDVLVTTSYIKESDFHYIETITFLKDGIEIAKYNINKFIENNKFNTNIEVLKENESEYTFYIYQVFVKDNHNLPLENVEFLSSNLDNNIYLNTNTFGFIELISVENQKIQSVNSNLNLEINNQIEKQHFFYEENIYQLKENESKITEQEFTNMNKDALISTYIKKEESENNIQVTTIENIFIDGILIQKKDKIENFDKNNNLINSSNNTENNESEYNKQLKNKVLISIFYKENKTTSNINLFINNKEYFYKENPLTIYLDEIPYVSINNKYELIKEEIEENYYHKTYIYHYKEKDIKEAMSNNKEKLTETKNNDNKPTISNSQQTKTSKSVKTEDTQNISLYIIFLFSLCVIGYIIIIVLSFKNKRP